MMFYVKIYLIALIAFLAVDFVWLALVARNFGSSPKSVGKKEMLSYFSNRSSGSTKGGRPFHLHHHIVLTGVKANATRRRKGLRGPSSKFNRYS